MTKQRGKDIYHMHDNLVALNSRNFTKFLLPHLRWKRITWTICAYLWPPILAGYREIDRLADTLAGIILPESCQEVNLEFEVREDVPEFRKSIQQQAKLCQKIRVMTTCGLQGQVPVLQPAGLAKTNGSILQFDATNSRTYTWVGSGQARWGTSALIRERETVKYHTIRLCWRARVPEREYTSYDCINCLDLANCAEVISLEKDVP